MFVIEAKRRRGASVGMQDQLGSGDGAGDEGGSSAGGRKIYNENNQLLMQSKLLNTS